MSHSCFGSMEAHIYDKAANGYYKIQLQLPDSFFIVAFFVYIEIMLVSSVEFQQQ